MKIFLLCFTLLFLSFNYLYAQEGNNEPCWPPNLDAQVKAKLPWLFGDSATTVENIADCNDPHALHSSVWLDEYGWMSDGSIGARISPDDAKRLGELFPKYKLNVKKMHDPNPGNHRELVYFGQELNYNADLADMLKFELNKSKEPLLTFMDKAKSSFVFGGGLTHYGGLTADTLAANGFLNREGWLFRKNVLTGRGVHLATLYARSVNREDCTAIPIDANGGPQWRNQCWRYQSALIQNLMSQVP